MVRADGGLHIRYANMEYNELNAYSSPIAGIEAA
jgi:hypothetical protein